jgi:hypothetical protein
MPTDALHIRWSDKAELDWERLDSRAEAEMSAARLVRLGETYTIEEAAEPCLRCRSVFQSNTPAGSQPILQYPWQQTVMDAFRASSEALPGKINIAERAIAARQGQRPDADKYERKAIKDALKALRGLIDETKPKSAAVLDQKKHTA